MLGELGMMGMLGLAMSGISEDKLEELKQRLLEKLPKDRVEKIEELAELASEISYKVSAPPEEIPMKSFIRYNNIWNELYGEKEEQTAEPSGESNEEGMKNPCFDFGTAIKLLKEGKKLSRYGWNGKEQYIVLGESITCRYPNGIIHEPVTHEDIGSKAIVFVGTRGRQMGWLASQSDMLAEDWHVV